MRNAAIVALLIAGCGGESATQVMLVIDAEDDARMASSVRLRILGGPDDGELVERRVVDLDVTDGWPIEVAIEPVDGDASRHWKAQAWALDGEMELGAGEAEGGFSEGKLNRANLVLEPGVDLGDVPGADDAGQGSDAGGQDAGPEDRYEIGGEVTGLLGSGLVLQNNGDDDNAIEANGPFAFATKLAAGTSYEVTVRTQPADPPQTCTVAQGTGTVEGTDVANVAITCCTCDAEDECCDGCAALPATTGCEADSDLTTLDHCDGMGACAQGPSYCDLHPCWTLQPTGQATCYSDSAAIACATSCDATGGPAYCGQDGQYPNASLAYSESTQAGDAIVTDSNSGLVWQKAINTSQSLNMAIATCEGSSYGGMTDWRLPNAHELLSLANFDASAPASSFPGMPSAVLWSSSVRQIDTKAPWAVDFASAATGVYDAALLQQARCVRGGMPQSSDEDRFVVVTEESQQTVLDRATGLIWQWDSLTQDTWAEALAYCESLSYAGNDDWRLPDVNELHSLVNYELALPATSFPDASAVFWLWTSTTVHVAVGSAWVINFGDGYVAAGAKDGTAAEVFGARCVRGGS